MPKRKVLGSDPLSWIKPTVQEEHDKLDREDPSHDLYESRLTEEVPKYRTYEVLLTLRLREDQLEFLSKLEREIMKKRSRNNRKERITKNSIIRAVIDVAMELNIDMAEVQDEKELIRRFKQVLNAMQ